MTAMTEKKKIETYRYVKRKEFTRSEVLDLDIKGSSTHMGLVYKDEWSSSFPVDHWRIQFEYGVSIYFFTGIGHRKILPPAEGRRFGKYANILAHPPLKNREEYMSLIQLDSVPVHPPVDDVLHSMVMDSYVLGVSFKKWAEEFGYDTDSIKARDIYFACQESGENLKSIFGWKMSLDEARERFSDY